MGAFQELAIPDLVDGSMPRWVREHEYSGKHQDMLEDLYSVGYWQEVCSLRKKNGDIKPGDMLPARWLDTISAEYNGDWPIVQEQIASAAARKAVAQADVLKEDFGQVFIEAAWNVNKRKLWQGGREEYETFEEFLIDAVPRMKDQSSELSDVLFLMEHFLPALAQAGGDFEPEKLMELPEHWGKARRAVPYLRGKVQDIKAHLEDVQKGTPLGEEVSKNFVEAVDNVIKTVADPTVPRDGPTGVGATLRKKDEGHTRPKQVDGYIAILPKKCVVFFTVPASWQRAVEKTLRTMVKFEAIDPEEGFQNLEKLIYPKRGKKS